MTHTFRGGTGLYAVDLLVSCSGRIDLSAVPAAVREARYWATDQLACADPPVPDDLIDSAVLLVSELVTNAIRAMRLAPGMVRRLDETEISLVITREPGVVRIEVYDRARGQVPPACDRSADAETGRGLMVIRSLSQRWGWHPCAGGKVVWCELTG